MITINQALTDARLLASPLGKLSAYPDHYDPGLLFAFERATNRQKLGLPTHHGLPFMGADIWTAYELSWLTPRGKPQVAIATLTVPCETPNIVESKSLKLYLNSFQSSRFANASELVARIRADVSTTLWGVPPGAATAPIGLKLVGVEDFSRQRIQELDGLSLDRMDIDCEDEHPCPESLIAAHDEQPVTETLTSNLLKSNCPVTNQPDWGSVRIQYSGAQIDQAGLLRYIVSFRNHQDFHEHCCERMFADIWTRCRPTKLAVYTRYTRRGGLDINPYRTSFPQALPDNLRTARQ